MSLIDILVPINSPLYVKVLIVTLIAYIIWEFLSHRINKGSLPGPSAVLPIFGQMFELIYAPWNFYERQAEYGPLSWSSSFGKTILFSKNVDITKEVFKTPSSYSLWLVWGAKSILGDRNLAFMQGEPHKELRKRLLPLFTQRSLSVFLPIQERVTRETLNQWCEESGNGEMNFCLRPKARDLNVLTSSTVFSGEYANAENRKEITEHFWRMNYGFLSFPYDIPFTPHRRAVESRKYLTKLFAGFAGKSLEKMSQPGAEPDCLIDLWMEQEIKHNQDNPLDHEDIGLHILDFHFAAQDASTSSIVWVAAHLNQYPEIHEKILKEQMAVRPNDEPITMDIIKKLTYTRQFVMELLRHRPPATMVPHIANVDTKLDGHKILKGTVILPSIWEAHKEVYENSEVFDPERFNPANEERAGQKFLTFGAGPHRCIGMTYAINHLIVFTSLLVRNYSWERKLTKGSDEIIFLPTIFPKDGCIMSLKRRSPMC